MAVAERQAPRVALSFLGCRVNQAEIEQWARQFRQAGCTIVAEDEEADVFVLNTCTITHVADHKGRTMIRRVVRHSPRALVVVTGCYASVDQGAVTAIEGVNMVIPNRDKPSLVTQVLERLREVDSEARLFPRSDNGDGLAAHTFARTRSFVKVQDGCDHHCTYCIVPIARGPARSLPLDEVVRLVQERVAQGYQEVVLTGIAMGSYGRDWEQEGHRGSHLAPPSRLPLLIRTILQETDVPRLRLSSIEPENLSVETLELWRNPRLCPHLHLPLQSGCDATLKRMGRGYRVEDYVNLVETARRIIPDLAVTTDIMVGFPGESEEEFAESLRVVRALEFAKIHVFRFSPRRGTAAMRLPHHIPEAVKKERSAIMQRLGEVSAQRFRQRFLGTIRDVLWEDGEPDHSYASGLTGNYLRIYAASAVRNTITPMYLARLMRDGIWGEPVAPAAPELGKEGIAHAH